MRVFRRQPPVHLSRFVPSTGDSHDSRYRRYPIKVLDGPVCGCFETRETPPPSGILARVLRRTATAPHWPTPSRYGRTGRSHGAGSGQSLQRRCGESTMRHRSIVSAGIASGKRKRGRFTSSSLRSNSSCPRCQAASSVNPVIRAMHTSGASGRPQPRRQTFRAIQHAPRCRLAKIARARAQTHRGFWRSSNPPATA